MPSASCRRQHRARGGASEKAVHLGGSTRQDRPAWPTEPASTWKKKGAVWGRLSRDARARKGALERFQQSQRPPCQASAAVTVFYRTRAHFRDAVWPDGYARLAGVFGQLPNQQLAAAPG